MPTKQLKLTPEMLLWNELKIAECKMEFSCGGDSMNDWEFHFYDSKGNEIKNQKTDELKEYFDDEVFKRVEFYVNSDGHYMGEAGSVIITLGEDDDEEPSFEYYKDAQSEWSETYTEKVTIDLTKDEMEVIREKISSMNGGEDEQNNVNYKIDCVISDEEETIIDNLLSKLSIEAREYEFEVDEEPSEWYSWTTNVDDEDGLVLTKKSITFQVSRSFTTYRPSED